MDSISGPKPNSRNTRPNSSKSPKGSVRHFGGICELQGQNRRKRHVKSNCRPSMMGTYTPPSYSYLISSHVWEFGFQSWPVSPSSNRTTIQATRHQPKVCGGPVDSTYPSAEPQCLTSCCRNFIIISTSSRDVVTISAGTVLH